MFGDFGETAQRLRFRSLGRIGRVINIRETLLLLPLRHRLLVANGSHAGFENIERNIREPLGMKLPELELVIVVVRRTEKNAAHPALGDGREFALRRIDRNTILAIERLRRDSGGVGLSLGLREPERGIGNNTEKLRPRDAFETHPVAGGFFQHESREIEKRVGFGVRLDLLDEALDSALLGEETNFPAFQNLLAWRPGLALPRTE